MDNHQSWGRRLNDGRQSRTAIPPRYINPKAKQSDDPSVDELYITRMQTMFFKVLQAKKTINIEAAHIYGASGIIKLAPSDIGRYCILMDVLEKQNAAKLPIAIENWCRVERDTVQFGLMINIEHGPKSTGMICFGPPKIEALQIRSLLKTLSTVQKVAAEMRSLTIEDLLCEQKEHHQ